MYVFDQRAATKALAQMLKPDGVLIIQEHDASIMRATCQMPLYQQARAWIWKTVEAEGGNIETGFSLYNLLTSAGFTDVSITADAIVETPAQAGLTASIVKAMLDRIEATGVATAQDIDVDTLEERLAAERSANAATVIGEMVFGALVRF